jgi:hypothetical protein
MMFGNPRALEASSISLRASGLQGLAGPSAEELKLLALDTGNVFLKSQGDAAEAFSFALDGVSTLSLKLPPPWNVVAGLSAKAAKQGLDGTRNYIKLGILNAGRYLPFDVASKTVYTLKSGGWGPSWKAAAKDKLVQYARTDMPGVVEFAFKAANSQLPPAEQLNLNVQTRFADWVYKVAMDNGATPWQAAAAAAATLYDGILKGKNSAASAWDAYRNWCKVVGASATVTIPEAWEAKAKGKLTPVTQKQLGKVSEKKVREKKEGGAGLAIGLGAGALALLAATR